MGGRRSKAAVAALIAAATMTGTTPPVQAAPPRPVTVYAHRGGSGLAPENTLGAFRQTHAQFGEQGVWLEMDTQLTADGHLVVIHDDTLTRTTNCTGTISSTRLADLAPCNAAEIFPSWPEFEPVPTLRDVLTEGRDNGWRVMVEIKNIPLESNFDPLGTKVADALVRLVREVGFPRSRLLVQSFWPLSLDRIEQRMPGAKTVFLTSATLPSLPVGIPVAVNALYSTLRKYEITSPSSESLDMNSLIVQVAHILGRRVVPYTPNSVGDITRIVNMGVDGVITDYPDRAYDVIN